jgi:outer membrane protein assembly factor BamD (BamD/ComL family)
LITLLIVGCYSNGVKKNTEVYLFNQFTEYLSLNNDSKIQNSLHLISSEYPKSKYIKISYLLLVEHYINKEKYKLALYFINIYAEKFYTNSDEEFITFTKNKIKYSRFKDLYKDQSLLSNTIEEIEESLLINSQNKYANETYTMLTHLKLLQNINNKRVSDLYNILQKTKSEQLYIDKYENIDNVQHPKKNIFKRFFY